MDICFVILHYNVIIETKNLITSIKERIDTENYKIIIVDNASPNKSGVELYREYEKDYGVDVILNEENIGFARGNNIGIDFSLLKYNPKFVCCLNNDTLLIQNNFYKLINSEFLKSNAAVIGPQIILKDNSIQLSAFRLQNIEYYQSLRNRYLGHTYINKNGTNLKSRIKRINPKLWNYISIIKNRYIYPGLSYRKENIVLHGCCLIFTPSFFRKLKGFNKRTFLYREEELLYVSLRKNNMLSVYNPKIKIKHLEDAATNSVVITSEQKKKFIAENEIISLGILIDELDEPNQ